MRTETQKELRKTERRTRHFRIATITEGLTDSRRFESKAENAEGGGAYVVSPPVKWGLRRLSVGYYVGGQMRPTLRFIAHSSKWAREVEIPIDWDGGGWPKNIES